MKKSLGEYRTGAIGSILDEYEKALFELKSVVRDFNETDYSRLVEGEDTHCHSVEVITNHVVRAGYGYSKYIRDALSIQSNPVEDKKIPQSEIAGEIDEMFAYTAAIFEGERRITDEEMNEIFFKTRWSIQYNIDQLLEHAIVHVLRHRRQIQKFLLKFETADKN